VEVKAIAADVKERVQAVRALAGGMMEGVKKGEQILTAEVKRVAHKEGPLNGSKYSCRETQHSQRCSNLGCNIARRRIKKKKGKEYNNTIDVDRHLW
jgi:hypothetical protein